MMDDGPLCARCAHERASGARRAWSLGTLAALSAPALAFFLSRHVSVGVAVGVWIGVACGVVVALAVAASQARRASRAPARVRRRELDDRVGVTAEPTAGQYNVVLVRAARAASPLVSARGTSIALGIAFLATASLLPAALKLPHWVEFEWVLLAWWVIGSVALAALLYRGARLADDHALVFPWDRPVVADPPPSPRNGETAKTRSSGWSDWLEPSGCFPDEGCAGVLIGIGLAAAAYAAAWFFVELVAPLVFFLFYVAVLRAVRRVTTMHVECRGRLGVAIAWGALWAAAYALPLSLVVRLVHGALHSRMR
jgi:hypothetical protein